MKFKFDATKALSIAATLLGVAGTILSNKVESESRKVMKSELKEELLKELTKSMNKES